MSLRGPGMGRRIGRYEPCAAGNPDYKACHRLIGPSSAVPDWKSEPIMTACVQSAGPDSDGQADQDAENRGGKGNQGRNGQKLLLLPLDGIRLPLGGIRLQLGHVRLHSGKAGINS